MMNVHGFLAVIAIVVACTVCVNVGEGRTIYSGHGQSFTWNTWYKVFNNQWGRNSATNSDWYQRIVLEHNNNFTFEYKWNGSTSQVKGYPVVMAGWHYGNPAELHDAAPKTSRRPAQATREELAFTAAQAATGTGRDRCLT